MSATEEDQSELPRTISGRFVWWAQPSGDAQAHIVRFPDTLAIATDMFDLIYCDEYGETPEAQFRGRFSPSFEEWFVEDLGFSPPTARWLHEGPHWEVRFDAEEHATMFALKWP